MNHGNRHLSAEDRAAIMMIRIMHSIRAIAAHLGRAPSIVSREIARHTVNSIKGYDAGLAGYRARLTQHRPRQRPKLYPAGKLKVSIHTRPPETEDRPPYCGLI